MKEVPTIQFLEEYARVVLQKNIESLYACGGGNIYNCQLTIISKFSLAMFSPILADSWNLKHLHLFNGP